jgi:hypothetical protein
MKATFSLNLICPYTRLVFQGDGRDGLDGSLVDASMICLPLLLPKFASMPYHSSSPSTPDHRPRLKVNPSNKPFSFLLHSSQHSALSGINSQLIHSRLRANNAILPAIDEGLFRSTSFVSTMRHDMAPHRTIKPRKTCNMTFGPLF